MTKCPKGQIKPKAVWAASQILPKIEQTNLFCFPGKAKKQKKTNSFVPFWGESTARQSAFGFI